MIQFRDVAVCYQPDTRYPVNALDGINLSIGAGEWVFFVGPSGAGKSTLLKLVYAGAHALRGQILVDSQDVTALAPREIPFVRRKIGVVFQDFQLLTQKTVWENVAFALQVIGAPQRQLVRDVPRALETVGLTHKSDARPHELSGGEQQRVAIARAIVNDPKILVADEPTGNLDPQTAKDIAEVLRKINARGTTILMATHDRALVDAMKQRVVRIADGRVISDEKEGVYHPEDDEPRQAEPAATTALDGALAEVIAEAEIAPHEPQALNISTQVGASANGAVVNGVSANGASPNGAAPVSEAHIPPRGILSPDSSGLDAPLVVPAIEVAPFIEAAHETSMELPEPLPSIATPQMTTPQIAPTQNLNGDATSDAKQNSSAQSAHAQSDLPPHVDSVAKARDNKAPIGSPENPILQFSPVPEPKTPHELEL